MNTKLLPMLLTSILANFTTPVVAFEELGEALLEPMGKPPFFPFTPGTKVHWLKNGANSVYLFERVDEDSYTVTRDDGCSWTRVTHMYAPTLSWKNCEYASGSQKIYKTKGSPWPLSGKTEFEYSYTEKYGGDLGQPWRSTWSCKVDREVRVRVPAGEYDTYKLVCEDDYLERTYWISPELGHHVALEEKSKIYISQWHLLEFVKATNP